MSTNTTTQHKKQVSGNKPFFHTDREHLMGKESCWSKLKRNGYGVPVVAVFRINHYRGDESRHSYIAAIPDGLSDGVFINRLRLPQLLKAVEKRFTATNSSKRKK